MRSFLNFKNINTIFLLLLILVIVYLVNTDFTGKENRFDLLSTAYQKTALQSKNNYRNENKILESSNISDSEILCSSFRQVEVEKINCLNGDLISIDFQDFGMKSTKLF